MSIVETVGAEIPRSWLRPLVYGLSAAGLALGVVAMITHNLVAIALLLVAPAPALFLAARNPALFEVRQRGGGRGFNPLVGGGAAGVGLAALGPHLIGLAAPLIGAGAGALAGVAIAAATAGKARLAAPIQYGLVLAALLALYGGAGLTLINVRFDTAAPQVFRTTIADKHISNGKSTNYVLAIPPWGPQTQRSTIGVPRSLYDAVEVGAPICMTLHPGALGSPWYEARPCAPTPAASPS